MEERDAITKGVIEKDKEKTRSIVAKSENEVCRKVCL